LKVKELIQEGGEEVKEFLSYGCWEDIRDALKDESLPIIHNQFAERIINNKNELIKKCFGSEKFIIDNKDDIDVVINFFDTETWYYKKTPIIEIHPVNIEMSTKGHQKFIEGNFNYRVLGRVEK
jgi:hypothetical protein